MCLRFIFTKTKAQISTENILGTWYMINGSHTLSKNYSLKTMAYFRYFELAKEFQQERYRLAVHYTFNPKTNLTFGIGYATGN